MGYSGGLSVMFTGNFTINEWQFDLVTLFVYPAMSGLILTLPQISKMFIEYSGEEK